MSNERIGDWFQTYTGRAWYPIDPRPEDICIEDIAHHLAAENRFNGASRYPYSVAQHSVYVSQLVPPEFALWGLLHDAAEAYYKDIPRPLKHSAPMDGYRRLEKRGQAMIYDHFGLLGPEPECVKVADIRILCHERPALMAAPPMPWRTMAAPGDVLPFKIAPWSAEQAESAFLFTFEKHSKRSPA